MKRAVWYLLTISIFLLFSALSSCSIFFPTLPVFNEVCDNSMEGFRQSGRIQCGHVEWYIHPQHVALFLGDVRPYLRKYDNLYRSFHRALATEPRTQRVRMLEQCPFGTSADQIKCPNGALESNSGAMYIWRGPSILSCLSGPLRFIEPTVNYWKSHDSAVATVNITSDFFARAFPFIANDVRQPLSSSFVHEFGHVFMPFQEQDDGYIWHPMLIEKFASFFGTIALLWEEIEHTGQQYYWDGWCLFRDKDAVCDDYIEIFEQALFVEHHKEWKIFLSGKNRREKAPQYIASMLIELYREYRKKGELQRYVEACQKTFQFYHRGLIVIPSHWRENQLKEQTPLVVRQKINVFVFLISAFIREDLSSRFEQWGVVLSQRTKQAIRDVVTNGYSENEFPRIVSELAIEGLSGKEGVFQENSFPPRRMQ